MSPAFPARPPIIQHEDIKSQIRKSLAQSSSIFETAATLKQSLCLLCPDAVGQPPGGRGAANRKVVGGEELGRWAALLAPRDFVDRDPETDAVGVETIAEDCSKCARLCPLPRRWWVKDAFGLDH